MVTFPMPAKCLNCDKRCDGRFFCSDECRDAYGQKPEVKERRQRSEDKALDTLNRVMGKYF